MSSWDSPIIRVSTGRLNTVNDDLIGGVAGGIGLLSKYAGQLGANLWVRPDQIAGMTDTTIGTLFSGRFKYVRMRGADDDSPVVQVGQILFWDTVVANWESAYQVTRDENLSSADNAVMIAGIYIGGFDTDNYGFIQDMGIVDIRFRSVLSVAGAIGGRVYAAATGDVGLDQGTADVLTTDSTSVANARYLGRAVAAPAAGSLTNVMLDLRSGVH